QLPLARPALRHRPAAAWWYTSFHFSSRVNPRTVVSPSITDNSVPVIVAKSSSSSVPTAVLSTVWCGAPAISHVSAATDQLGRGSQTAHATGSFGNGAVGSTTRTS